jgi:hypothetical protein
MLNELISNFVGGKNAVHLETMDTFIHSCIIGTYARFHGNFERMSWWISVMKMVEKTIGNCKILWTLHFRCSIWNIRNLRSDNFFHLKFNHASSFFFRCSMQPIIHQVYSFRNLWMQQSHKIYTFGLQKKKTLYSLFSARYLTRTYTIKHNYAIYAERFKFFHISLDEYWITQK